MNIIKILSSICICLAVHLTYAHTMWMQANNTADKGSEQEIKVFFGEFSWGKPSNTAKWFSDIKDYQLMVTEPDGTTAILSKKRQDSLYYVTDFTPAQKGVYTFSFKHVVADVYKDKKITYISSAYIAVDGGKKDQLVVGEGTYQLSIPDPAKPTHIIYLVDGKPAPDMELEIAKENSKDVLTVKTNDKGELQFPKEWKGNFLIELPDSKQVAPTEHNGQTYEYDYKVFCYYVVL